MSYLDHIYVSSELQVAVIITGVGIMVTIVLLRLLTWLQLRKHLVVFLEVTPPASVHRNSIATKQLFSVIHGQRTKGRFLSRSPVMSFEIVSTSTGGIRYLVRVEQKLAQNIEQALVAYIPDIKIRIVKDYVSSSSTKSVYEFTQTGHYTASLISIDSAKDYDPLSYVTNAMAGMLPDELISFQLVVTPLKLRTMRRLAARMPQIEDMRDYLQHHAVPYLGSGVRVLNRVLFAMTDTIGDVYHGSTRPNYSTSAQGTRQQSQTVSLQRPDRFGRRLMESTHHKLEQPLFRVSIRLFIQTPTRARAMERASAISAALDGYMAPPYQGLKRKMQLPGLGGYRGFLFRRRLPAFSSRQACILSATELADLYHFPDNTVSKTDDLVTSFSRTLSSPLSLKQIIDVSVVLGKSNHHGHDIPISLTERDRERHLYVIGGTGNGKTTMLQYAIIQDMQNSKGVAVIDPHGDMAEMLLRHIPKDRMNDVIYFNPDDLDYPIGLNLLELMPGLTDNALLREKDLVTESVISVFRKTFSEDDTGGHRIEYILRNAVHTALTVEGATIFTVLKLLQNPAYRKKVIATLTDEDLKDFWRNELGKAGDMQRVKMSAGITAKIGRFNSNAAAKSVLSQARSTIDIEDIMNSGKILICNFSKGLLGEDVSELFGVTVLAKLQLASLKRARLQQQKRRPFYVYVDEFQNFATPSFVQMLSESRKYKVFMHMAEQSTSQQKDQRLVHIILANVGTIVCFRTGNPHDERLLLPLFHPHITEGEIANLSAHTFYARLASVTAQEPLSGRTVLLTDDGSITTAQAVREASRRNYTDTTAQIT